MLSFLELVSGLTTPAIHPARAAQIAAINANSSLTWRAAANARFAFQPPGASRSSNGVLGDWAADIRAAVARGDVAHYVPADATLALPESFDSEEHWKECAKVIGDIRDQSNCGCCWAFAGAEAASDRMCIATGGKMVVPLSAQAEARRERDRRPATPTRRTVPAVPAVPNDPASDASRA